MIPRNNTSSALNNIIAAPENIMKFVCLRLSHELRASKTNGIAIIFGKGLLK